VKNEQVSDSGMETISAEDKALFATADEEIMQDTDSKNEEGPATEVEGDSEMINMEYAEYEVKLGDTLMLVAYQVLGDYQKWPEIAKLNKEVLGAKTTLEKGQKLRFIKREITNAENPMGSPYLIKPRDTLGGVSNKVYGTIRLWDELYFNNKNFIKNPNVLYSGFVVFYPTKEEIPQIQVAMVEQKFDVFAKTRFPASVKKK
jgi:carbamoylphosphate synthase large subunit